GLAVIHLEGTNFSFALRDGDMPRAIVPHQQHVIVVVRGIVFGERTAGSEQVHDFHGLDVLDLVFAGHGDAARRQETGSEDDGTYRLFIWGTANPLVVVHQRAQFVPFDHAIE